MSTTGAKAWVTDRVSNLFLAEIANERDGGVAPSTLESTIDSVVQCPEVMCEGWATDDFVALLQIVALAGPETEVRELLS